MPKRTHNGIPSGEAHPPPRVPITITKQRAVVMAEQIKLGYLPAQARRIAAWFVPWHPPPEARRRRARRA